MATMSPGAMAILQARQQYQTRPDRVGGPDPMDLDKPKPGGGTNLPIVGPGNGAPGLAPPDGGRPGADVLARHQRMQAYRTQHAQFNAGRRVYGNNNNGEIPVYDNATWLPGQRPDQTPGTGSYAQANAPRTPAGTTGTPTPMGAGSLTSPAGTAAGPPTNPNAPGPNHPSSQPKPTYGDGGGPNKSGTDRSNGGGGLRYRLGMI